MGLNVRMDFDNKTWRQDRTDTRLLTEYFQIQKFVFCITMLHYYPLLSKGNRKRRRKEEEIIMKVLNDMYVKST